MQTMFSVAIPTRKTGSYCSSQGEDHQGEQGSGTRDI